MCNGPSVAWINLPGTPSTGQIYLVIGGALRRLRLRYFRCFCTAFFFLSLAFTFGCGFSGGGGYLPNASAPNPNVISLNPQDWYILYSNGVGPHPLSDPADGVWSIQIPSSVNVGLPHLNYVQTPFDATKTPKSVTITFEVISKKPQYEVFGDKLPATFRLYFEVKNDNLSEPNGRWWVPNPSYDLGSQDNQVHVISVPLTSDQWSNVYGKHDAVAFANALKNVGWFGLTFGGQSFAGHGAALTSGSAKFVLIDYKVKTN